MFAPSPQFIALQRDFYMQDIEHIEHGIFKKKVRKRGEVGDDRRRPTPVRSDYIYKYRYLTARPAVYIYRVNGCLLGRTEECFELQPAHHGSAVRILSSINALEDNPKPIEYLGSGD